MGSHNAYRIRFALAASIALALCQFSSYLVETRLPLGESERLFSFLHLTHIRNYGGIFGLLQGKGWLFAAFAFALIVGLTIYVLRGKNFRPIEYLFYGLIVGGGMSNIVDRLVYGSVIDFIDIRGLPYWSYIFNLADCMIHLGVWPLVALHLFWMDEGASPTQEIAKDPGSGS